MDTATSIFAITILTDNVILKPYEVYSDIKFTLLNKLQTKYEGSCSQFGYVKPGTIEVVEYAPGRVQAISLNGDVIYKTTFRALICNPHVGQVVEMTVVTKNRFGVMGECCTHVNGQRIIVMEIVLAKHIHESTDRLDPKRKDVIDIDGLVKGQRVFVEVLGRKFQLGDHKISVLGHMIQNVDDVGLAHNLDNDGTELNELQDDEEDGADVVSVLADEDLEVEEDEEDGGEDDEKDEDDDEDVKQKGGKESDKNSSSDDSDEFNDDDFYEEDGVETGSEGNSDSD